VLPYGLPVRTAILARRRSAGAEQGDLLEVGMQLTMVGLAARDEQVALPVAGQQSCDDVLAPDPSPVSCR